MAIFQNIYSEFDDKPFYFLTCLYPVTYTLFLSKKSEVPHSRECRASEAVGQAGHWPREIWGKSAFYRILEGAVGDREG